MLFFALAACASSDDSAVLETPTISFLAPSDGATVPVGDVALSIVVESFTLQDPAKHNEGQPEGYIQVAWTDGKTTDQRTSGSTTPTIELPSAGSWTLTGELYFVDGDEITEDFPDYVPATLNVTAE